MAKTSLQTLYKACERNNKAPLLVLPHTTHRLQPLDVGLFQPLSTEYSAELDKHITSSCAVVSMSKGLFYPMFKQAWDKSFTKENIVHAFEKLGI